MKFAQELSPNIYSIHSVQSDSITVRTPAGEQTGQGEREHVFRESFAICPQRLYPRWCGGNPDELLMADMQSFLDYEPEVILLGTGRKMGFPNARLMAELAGIGIGLETMDTAAACRTYNVLAGEGRRVLAALIIDPVDA